MFACMYWDCLHGAYTPPSNRWNEISWTCMAWLARGYTGAYKVKAGKPMGLVTYCCCNRYPQRVA